MDLEWVQTFLAAAEAESFREAARRRFISQAAVSQQMARLETDLGLRLFDRRGRRVRLNAAGTEFRPYAERLVRLAEDGRRRLAGAVPSRHLTIGADWLTAETVVPWLCRRLLESDPGLDLEVKPAELGPGDPGSGWDVALLTAPPRPGYVRSEWLFADSVEFIVPADGADWDRDPPDAEVMLRSLRLMVPKDAAYWPAVAKALEDRGLVPRTMGITQLGAIRRLVQEGVGAAFLPRLAVARELMEGRLLALDVDFLPPPSLSTYWAVRRDDPLRAPVGLAEALLRRRWPRSPQTPRIDSASTSAKSLTSTRSAPPSD